MNTILNTSNFSGVNETNELNNKIESLKYEFYNIKIYCALLFIIEDFV